MGVSFHEVQFPPSISYGARGGPGFRTAVQTLSSGVESRNIDWSRARASYDVSHGVKTQADIDQLIAFFYARRAKAYGFRFKDWTDFNLPNVGNATPVLFTTNGAANSFQLTKVYGDAGNSYTRIIAKPVAGTLQLLNNGVQVFSPASWTVDTTTGIVTLSAAIAATTGHQIAGTCQFDVPVRFDTDEMQVSIDDFGKLGWPSIPLVEVRDI